MSSFSRSRLDEVILIGGSSDAVNLVGDFGFWAKVGCATPISCTAKVPGLYGQEFIFVTFTSSSVATRAVGIIRQLGAPAASDTKAKFSAAYPANIVNSFVKPAVTAHGMASLGTEYMAEFVQASFTPQVTEFEENLAAAESRLSKIEEEALPALKQYTQKEDAYYDLVRRNAETRGQLEFNVEKVDALFELLDKAVADAQGRVMDSVAESTNDMKLV